jgi:hypothetical protein
VPACLPDELAHRRVERRHPYRVPTKRWHVKVDPHAYDIEVRTSGWTGSIRLFINGTESRRGPLWRESAHRITFPLGGHLATLVWTRYGRANPQYDLVLDGRSLTTGAQPRPPANPYESLGVQLLLFVAALAILGGVLWFAAVPEIRLAAEGRQVPATVIDARVATGRSTAYYLRYVFVTAEGENRTAEGRVSYLTYRSVHPKDVITVSYVPSAPEIQRPASYDERFWIAALGLIFALILAAATLGVWRAYRSQAILAVMADRALRTSAIVERISKGLVEIGLRRIRYRYEDAEGRAHKGISPRLYVEEASAYAPGSSATIGYDPNDPGRSMWLGAADPKTTVWVTGAQ